jgi:poly(ADP-ribose) glycohydrolase ARH3
MTNPNPDRIAGSLLGLAIGDAFGAPYEGGPLERGVWALIGRRGGKRRWSDDTQMTIDVVQSLLDVGRVDQDDLAQRFARSYRWSRGYGPGAAKLLRQIRRGQPWRSANRSVFSDGSLGNGGAMRAPAMGLYYAAAGEQAVSEAAKASAAVTHAHPLGCEGAALIALAVVFAYHDLASDDIIERLCQTALHGDFVSRLHRARTWLQAGETASPHTVAAELGNGVTAVESCVTAIYVALRFRDRSFDDMLAFVIKLRGDVDTIAAMAGAIWGAARGLDALPPARLARLEQCDRLLALAQSLAENVGR